MMDNELGKEPQMVGKEPGTFQGENLRWRTFQLGKEPQMVGKEPQDGGCISGKEPQMVGGKEPQVVGTFQGKMGNS